MQTVYHPFKVALTEDQGRSLTKAVKENVAVTLRVKPEQIGKGNDLLLTATQINHLKKAAGAGRGADITFSKTQISKTKKMIGGNLFSTALSLGRALAPSVGKTLGMAGLSFGAEKLLKKIFRQQYWAQGGAALQTCADDVARSETGP